MSEELTTYEAQVPEAQVYQSAGDRMVDSYRRMWNTAVQISQSDIIPDKFRNKPGNCLIAMDMSSRMGMSTQFVMSSLDIIKGKPSWSSQFIISAINSCGRFEPLRFELTGQGNTMACFAWTRYKSDGTQVKGTTITAAMVKAEGWESKPGSKWKTMPEQMYQYRSASFFGRLHCPDVLNGMYSVEESMDIANSVAPRVVSATSKLLGEAPKQAEEAGENGTEYVFTGE